MKQLLIATLLTLLLNTVKAQKEFIIKNGSPLYTASIYIDSCSQENCEGKASVKLFSKQTGRLFQTLVSEDLYFFLDFNQRPTVNVIELYNEQSPLIFDDFNFDGAGDLAIRNGNNSSYDGPSYDVYVFNKTRQQFVLSDELTTLVTDNLGMFQTDAAKKRLVVFSKSGCCWHLKTEYAVVPGKGLQKVFELEEDAQGGKWVIVTQRILINGKWVKKVNKYTIGAYYKN